MTEPSNPIETVSEMRVDEETEKLIFAVWRRSPESKFAIVALRSRIRELVEEARKEERRYERTPTEDEWAVIRIATTRFERDMTRQGYYDPELQKALQTLKSRIGFQKGSHDGR